MRITLASLQCVVDQINKATGSPLHTWTESKTGMITANPGNYHLDGAYGGWQLQRICNSGGGVDLPFQSGFVSKRDLLTLLQAFLAGVQHAKEIK